MYGGGRTTPTGVRHHKLMNFADDETLICVANSFPEEEREFRVFKKRGGKLNSSRGGGHEFKVEQ
jgi:hypothetical protein